MSLSDFKQKIKVFAESISRQDFLLSAVVVLVAFSSFGLGRLSRIEEVKQPIKISKPVSIEAVAEVAALAEAAPVEQGSGVLISEEPAAPGGQVVASKNGSKYHFPWCAGAKQISERNKIYFASAEAARAKGYTPAANCKGLK